MLDRRPSTDLAAALQRQALTEMGKPYGIDYTETFFRSPTSDEEVGYQALRCGASLLIAFIDPPSWGLFQSRATKKLAKRAAQRLSKTFPKQSGQGAISWLTQRYGRTMSSHRRAAAAAADPASAATLNRAAAAEESLSDLVAKLWPVDNEAALTLAASPWEVLDAAPDAPLAHANARMAASIEAICTALWPGSEELYPVLAEWVLGYTGIGVRMMISRDWINTAPQWINLLESTPDSYGQVIERPV